ncbi:hypothetical protein MLD38_038248 [Melastoma candidum]|uniref:Uncharacterized protein n=1 Tax=Melastoma candidum TaxID=119954 RepID=A0ACB9KZH7_9MYRT|nr:hypothetical protein MLD38_038248 [Melastoma candidum]
MQAPRLPGVPVLRWSTAKRSTECPNQLHRASAVRKRQPKRGSVSTDVGLRKQTEKELSRILRTESAVEGIERKSNSNKHKSLWPRAVLEALDDAIARNRHISALKIFGLLRKQWWYVPRCQTYTRLLVMLGKCRQSRQAELLFDLMLSEGLKPTVDVYTALVGAYGQSGCFDEALSTIEAMKSGSACQPDVYTYSVLIGGCTLWRQFDLVDQLVADMSYLGIECSIVTYNTIIAGYGRAEMFDEMERSLTEMVDRGSCLPDVFTLNSVVGAYGKSGQVDKMEKWYEDFQLMGVTPDIITFNTLIGAYGKAGLYEKMTSVIQYMESRFFPLTTTTYNIIIDVYGKGADLESMNEYFKRMKHQGMKPNSVTYCSLISAYAKARQMVKVDSIYKQVNNSDVVLDTPFFNCIISAYGQAGDLQKMSELFQEMQARKCEPDYITFATMVQAYNDQGMTELAKELENTAALKDQRGLKLIGG